MERSPQNHPQVREGFLAEEVAYSLECFLGDWRVVAAVIQECGRFSMAVATFNAALLPVGCPMPESRRY